MQKAYFQDIQEQIVDAIKSSNTEIKIAVAWFTDKTLFSELLDCLNRNISIQLIIRYDEINCLEGSHSVEFNQFIANGGKLFFAKPDYPLHDKFCIIDDSILINGSYNWTYYARQNNHENIVVTNESNIISEFKVEFDSIISELSLCETYSPIPITEIEKVVQNPNLEYLNEDMKSQKKHDRNIKKTITPIDRTRKIIREINGHTSGEYTYSIIVYDDHISLNLRYDDCKHRYDGCKQIQICLTPIQIEKLVETINNGVEEFLNKIKVNVGFRRKDVRLYNTTVKNMSNGFEREVSISAYFSGYYYKKGNDSNEGVFGISSRIIAMPCQHWHIPISQKELFIKNIQSALIEFNIGS